MNSTPTTTPLTPPPVNRPHAHALRPLVVAAFAAVYIAWGGTYLGIRIAIESITVFFMAAARFLLAGTILLLVLRLWKPEEFRWGSAREWRDAALCGVLLLLCGNGGVSWAEHTVPSGVVALITAGVPLWMVLFDWARLQGQRPSARTLFGLALGIGGIAILCGPKLVASGANGFSWAYLAVLAANLCWSAGAIYSRHTHTQGSPLLAVARQMLMGGLALLITGFATGEASQFSFAAITPRSLWGFAYLLTFGSLLGYTAYVWLMKVSTPARVGTISYVNPVIAVLVGWAIGGEELTLRIVAGSVVIVAAVVIVIRR